MIVYLDRINSYPEAAKTLGVSHTVFYRKELNEQRLILENFVKGHMQVPAEVLVVEEGGEVVSMYWLADSKRDTRLEKVGEMLITPFGEEPIRNEAGFAIFGEYPSLKTNKKQVYQYFEEHVDINSKELLLLTTSIHLLKRVPWFGVCVNPKIIAAREKVILPNGTTVPLDFKKHKKWSYHMDFEQTGTDKKQRSKNKKMDNIRFNAYSFREAAKDRERMNSGDFSPKKLKKVEYNVREKTPNNYHALAAYNMSTPDERKERREKLGKEKGPICDTCPIKNDCPAYVENAVCAFIDDYQRFAGLFDTRDKTKLQIGLNEVIQSESQRYAKMVLEEKVSGQTHSETRYLAESLVKSAKAVVDMIEGKNKGDAGPKTVIMQDNRKYAIGKVNEELAELPSEARADILRILKETRGQSEAIDNGVVDV